MAEFINIKAGFDLQIEKTKGNAAIVFHIPGHCAGCKRAIELIQDMSLEDWVFYLVDAEEEANRPLIDSYEATIAPTIITFNSGVQSKRVNGLKEFIKQKEDLFKHEPTAN